MWGLVDPLISGIRELSRGMQAGSGRRHATCLTSCSSRAAPLMSSPTLHSSLPSSAAASGSSLCRFALPDVPSRAGHVFANEAGKTAMHSLTPLYHAHGGLCPVDSILCSSHCRLCLHKHRCRPLHPHVSAGLLCCRRSRRCRARGASRTPSCTMPSSTLCGTPALCGPSSTLPSCTEGPPLQACLL